jgi:predicted component of type VI protein secretion system
MLAFCLEVVGRQSWTILLAQQTVLIGRTPPCDIVLSLDHVGRRHCELRIDGGTPLVRDVGSPSGTYKNGRRLTGEEELSPDDLLLAGSTRIRARVVLAPPPPPEPDVKGAQSTATTPLWLAELSTRGTPLRRLVAANPASPGGLLEALSCCPDLLTQRAVARNPNTPRDTLFRLSVHHPEDFLDNPVFPLLLLEDPQLGQLPAPVLSAIARPAGDAAPEGAETHARGPGRRAR